MRVYRQYSYKLSSKISYHDALEEIDSFLARQGLSYELLAYDFTCYDLQDHSRQIVCHQIARRFPQFGGLTRREYIDPKGNVSGVQWCLSNQDEFGRPLPDLVTEEDVRMIAKKIPRPYKPVSVSFTYLGIDFFGRSPVLIPNEIGFNDLRCYTLCPNITVSSSYNITSAAKNLDMLVDVTDQNGVLDAQHYASLLSECFGNLKVTVRTMVALEPEKRERLAVIAPATEIAAGQIRQELEKRAPELFQGLVLGEHRPFREVQYQLARPLKKLAKEYGYGGYAYSPAHIYSVKKRTGQGHWIKCCFLEGTDFRYIDLIAEVYGPGFSHRFVLAVFRPDDQREAEAFLRCAFAALQVLERELLPNLTGLYPPTPDWFE